MFVFSRQKMKDDFSQKITWTYYSLKKHTHPTRPVKNT